MNRHNGNRRSKRDIVSPTPSDPMTDLAVYQREHPMEQTYFSRPLRAVESRPRDATPPAWTPVVDVFEEADSVRVVAELPGVRPKDVSVALEGNRLTITGAKTRIEEEPAVKVRRHERTYGEFRRTFRLGAAVDFANVTAAYDFGVLTITLPKAESAKRRQIAVMG